jgi:hypothetical protein
MPDHGERFRFGYRQRVGEPLAGSSLVDLHRV